MRPALAALAAPLLAIGAPAPAGQARSVDPAATAVARIAEQADFAGVLLASRGDRVLIESGFGPVAPGGVDRHRPTARWRLASITKQVFVAQLLSRRANDPGFLDRPITGQPGWQGMTPRLLLTHRSGLPNPDDTPPGAGGVPGFYLKPTPDLAYCRSRPAVAAERFRYNNCDYLIADQMWPGSGWPRGLALVRPGDVLVRGYVGGKPEPTYLLTSYGAAAGLTGTARDLWAFDRALMTGRLMPDAIRAEMWRGDPALGYQAVGQWVFPATLKGCAGPVTVVQRDGSIGGVQTRNYIVPDKDVVVIAFTNRSEDDFAFGNLWEGRGFAHDLLSAVACA